jgi:hypothetical protein
VNQTISYVDFVEPRADAVADVPFYEFGIVASGLPTNGVVKFEITINYEFIPLFVSLDIITPEASPVDITEENLVKSWIPDMPKSSIINPATLGNPQAEISREDNFGLGMLFDVTKEIMPLLLGAL